MKVVAIVQARMGSTRLPGKVLADLGGRPLLEHVIRRVALSVLTDEVWVATTERKDDDILAALARETGASVFRGAESDVLGRYAGTAKAASADVCVRVTADCPLIDAEIVDRVIDAFLDAPAGADYASNRLKPGFPRGLDTEVFTVEALGIADREATLPFDRSHVTTYLYRHPERFRLLDVENDEDLSSWRWTVDEADDLRFVRAVIAALGPGERAGFREIRALLRRRPELLSINAHVIQKRIEDG
jgi:spore coat polysaccharide biosynthesis protein SpsF (cytidylyltransferase family)